MNARAKAQDQRERSRHELMRQLHIARAQVTHNDRRVTALSMDVADLRAERDAWKYLHEEADDECDKLRRELATKHQAYRDLYRSAQETLDDLNEAREHPWRFAWKQWRSRG